MLNLPPLYLPPSRSHLRYQQQRKSHNAGHDRNDRESDPPHRQLGWGWLAGV
jgi:hypothetical protein